MAAPVCEPRIRIAALLVLEGKVLLVRHRKGESTYHLLPGGGVEYGETLAEALVREVSEETGLTIRCDRLLLISDTVSPSGDRHVVNIVFAATRVGGTLVADPSDERIEAVELVDPADLADLDLRPPAAAALLDAVQQGDTFRATYLGSIYAEE